MYSMTGYGKGIAERDGRRITVELKSVNHRFLDLFFKLPRSLTFLEDVIRKTLSARLNRGHVEVFLLYENLREDRSTVSVDAGLAARYLAAANELAAMGFDNNFGVAEAIKIPDLLQVVPEEDDQEAVVALTTEALGRALDGLIEMRRTEGEKLIADLSTKVNAVDRKLQEVERRAPMVAAEHRTKLAERIAEALGEVKIDETKLASEVAFFVDKSNIDEEITRLRGHIAHYGQILSVPGPVGKKLDFLTQETNREVNTIGSKSNDLILTQAVLDLKNIVEMIREQVQNLE